MNLYIIRGLPGSGKSTLARLLVLNYHEADNYFMVDGEYKFDPRGLKFAHEACQNAVEFDMVRQYEHIAVSNTFTQRWEIAPYILLAEKYGYRVTEITMSGPLYGNIHNVPEDKIQMMRDRWEK